jgi:AAA family ATP:ADP antiporter
LITNRVDRRQRGRSSAPPRAAPGPAAQTENAFGMVFRTRYLLLMALMLMLLNWVNTTGEYILGSVIKDNAVQMVAEGRTNGLTEGELIGDFYSKYFGLVNVVGLLMQLFVVSRVVKYLGIPVAVMILPVISLCAYNVLAFYPALRLVLAAKVAENSTDYSLNNTVRNMLFLPCTYEEKFAAKQAIDSFFVRMGDVLSAGLVFIGTTVLLLAPQGFAAVNAAIVVVWLVLAWRVGREYKRLTTPGARTIPAATPLAPAPKTAES